MQFLPARARAQLLASVPRRNGNGGNAGRRRIEPTRVNLGVRAAENAAAKARRRRRGFNRLKELAGTVGTVNNVYPNAVRENLRRNLNLTRPQMNKVISILRSGFGANTFYFDELGVQFLRMIVHRVKTIPNLPNTYNFGWHHKESSPNNVLRNTGNNRGRVQTNIGPVLRHRARAAQMYNYPQPPLNFRQISHSRRRITNEL